MPEDEIDSLEDDEAADGTALETEADVRCPHCGETVTIDLDPAGGKTQTYVQDCEVCCRSWQVSVWYHAGGGAEVELVALE
jgi:hypothetical protein